MFSSNLQSYYTIFRSTFHPRVSIVKKTFLPLPIIPSSPFSSTLQRSHTSTKLPPNTRLEARPAPCEHIREPVTNPIEKYREKVAPLHQYGQYLMSCLPKYVQQFSVWKDELVLFIPPSAVLPVFHFLKYHTAAEYTQVSCITAVDYPAREYRFEVVYNLLSVRYNSRLRVKTYANESTPVPSITKLYDGANWYEREVFDMFGIFFVGHPDLRRILTDYGFDGHPLRKDFPLSGFTEIRFDEEKKRIVVEPLELTQAYRNFRGGSTVWEPVGPGLDLTPEQFKLPSETPSSGSTSPTNKS